VVRDRRWLASCTRGNSFNPRLEARNRTGTALKSQERQCIDALLNAYCSQVSNKVSGIYCLSIRECLGLERLSTEPKFNDRNVGAETNSHARELLTPNWTKHVKERWCGTKPVLRIHSSHRSKYDRDATSKGNYPNLSLQNRHRLGGIWEWSRTPDAAVRITTPTRGVPSMRGPIVYHVP
jgi:hypothetical protein